MLHPRTWIILLAMFTLSLMAGAQVTFTTTVYSTGSQSLWVTTGDFDRDGKPDFAAVGAFSNSVSVFRNVGGGKFTQIDTHSVGNPIEVETADFNKDGKLDLLVASGNQPLMTLFTGVGGGIMAPGGSFATMFPVWEFALGDFNNDGAVDVVAQECEPQTANCVLNTYKNDGAGHFSPWQTLFTAGNDLVPAARRRLAVADFNQDGKLDVVVLRSSDFNIFLGHGDGTFAAPTGKFVPGSRGLTPGSFNADSFLDIALSRTTPSCTVTPCTDDVLAYLNDGTGNLTLRSKDTIVGSFLFAVDINGDGLQDLLALRPAHFGGHFNYVLGNGHGQFGAATHITDPDSGAMVVARDMNLDGRKDIFIPEDVPGDTLFLLNNNASVICAPPGSAAVHAKICAPLSGSTVSTTFTVRGSGNSPAGVQRVELWIDGKKRAESAFNDQLRATVTVSTGTHRVAIVAVDKFGPTATTGVNVTAH